MRSLTLLIGLMAFLLMPVTGFGMHCAQKTTKAACGDKKAKGHCKWNAAQKTCENKRTAKLNKNRKKASVKKAAPVAPPKEEVTEPADLSGDGAPELNGETGDMDDSEDLDL